MEKLSNFVNVRSINVGVSLPRSVRFHGRIRHGHHTQSKYYHPLLSYLGLWVLNPLLNDIRIGWWILMKGFMIILMFLALDGL